MSDERIERWGPYLSDFLAAHRSRDRGTPLEGRLADSLCLSTHHRLPDSEGACDDCLALVDDFVHGKCFGCGAERGAVCGGICWRKEMQANVPAPVEMSPQAAGAIVDLMTIDAKARGF